MNEALLDPAIGRELGETAEGAALSVGQQLRDAFRHAGPVGTKRDFHDVVVTADELEFTDAGLVGRRHPAQAIVERETRGELTALDRGGTLVVDRKPHARGRREMD